MAETPKSTNPLAPGLQTSEGKLTAIAQVVGFLIATYGGLLTQYSSSHPDLKWPAVAVMLVGVLLSAATLFGYQKGRAVVKSTALQQLIEAGAPVTVTLLEQLLQKQLAPGGTPLKAPANAPGQAATAISGQGVASGTPSSPK